MSGKKDDKFPDLTKPKKARLAGAIWIYGSIHVPTPRADPKIVISMPIPLAYHYKEDSGGLVTRGDDGYFTLQIAGQKLVKKRLEEIQPLMGGEEAIQIDLALKMLRTKESNLTTNERNKKLDELYAKYDRSRKRLEQWMKKFVESHKDEPEKKMRGRKQIWNKAYDWARFMRENGYKRPEWERKDADEKKATKS